jgi:MFS family permease
VTIIMLVAAVVLLTAFVFIESRVAHPLLPLRVVTDRTRAGSYLAIGISGIAVFAVFLFLTYFLQGTKGFTPIQGGLAFLPMTAVIVVTAALVNTRFLAKVGPRPLLVLGMSVGAVAMAWFAQLEPDSSYVGHVLPGLLVLGFGMGNIFAPAIASATYGVDPRDTGVASAMVNTMQQVGGSVGTALLSSIFASAAASFAEGKTPTPQLAGEAAVHGYTVAFWVAAGVFAVGAVIVGVTMRSIKVAQPAGEPVVAH